MGDLRTYSKFLLPWTYLIRNGNIQQEKYGPRGSFWLVLDSWEWFIFNKAKIVCLLPLASPPTCKFPKYSNLDLRQDLGKWKIRSSWMICNPVVSKLLQSVFPSEISWVCVEVWAWVRWARMGRRVPTWTRPNAMCNKTLFSERRKEMTCYDWLLECGRWIWTSGLLYTCGDLIFRTLGNVKGAK